jgi:branched-chain amino acid transport system permease protein
VILQAIVDGLVLGAVYAMVAIGFSVIFATTQTFHFAHGGIYVFVAFTIAALAHDGTTLWLVAFPIGLVTAVVLAVSMEVGIYAPMRKRAAGNALGHYGIFVASLGLLVVLNNLIPLIFGYDPYFFSLYGVRPALKIGPVFMQTAGLVQFVTALVMLALVMAILRWTQFGRAMRGLASNVDMTALVGIEPRRVYIGAFVLGSALLVPAALLNTVTTGLDSSRGATMILIALVAVIIGGVQSIPGAALGGFLIGIAQSLSLLVVPSTWEETSAYVLLLAFLLFRPTGIFGSRTWDAGV